MSSDSAAPPRDPLPREARLAGALVELADTLGDDVDVVALLSRLVDRCLDVLDVGAAGIVVAGPDGDLRVLASSIEATRLLERFEVGDADAGRPCFAAEARAAGFGAVHALPLRRGGTVLGVLHLFHRSAAHLHRADVDAGQALADMAAIAILQHRAALEARVVNAQLHDALDSRVVIEQAKGMLAERDGIELEHAFRVLRDHARNNNLHLADVAGAVVAGTIGGAG